jgi:hypothetical protein
MQGVQVNLVAQPDPEGLDDAGRVVAAPVEAPGDRLLEAATARLESWPSNWPSARATTA